MQVSSVFQYINDEFEVLEVARPQCEPLDSLISVINKHYGIKDSVVDEFINYHVNFLMWEKWDKYKRKLDIYEDVKTAIEDNNAANSDNPEYTPEALPVKPTWSDDDISYITTEYVLNLPDVKTAIRNKQKQQRQNELDNATVEVDGMAFDADEVSQQRFMFALQVAAETGQTSTQWKLADNTWAEVTVTQMKAVLVAAGAKLAEIMQKYG